MTTFPLPVHHDEISLNPAQEMNTETMYSGNLKTDHVLLTLIYVSFRMKCNFLCSATQSI